MPKTTIRISEERAIELADSGAKIIDLRAPSRYTESVPYQTSYQMFREKMTQAEIDTWVKDTLSQDERYLIVCEGAASCFSAVMLVYDLERLGFNIIGITDINKPEGEKGYDFQLPPYDTLTPLP